MARKKEDNQELLIDVEGNINKAEQFFEENKKPVSIVIGGILAIVALWFAYTNLYLEPREAEAQQELFAAQRLFQGDSLQAALNGNPETEGFLAIIDNYGGTKAANLSKYYAGVSFLNLSDYENAIKYLDKFSSNDKVLSVIKLGAIGDAFAELNQPKEALDYYEKAVKKAGKNDFLAPYYLKKAGDLALIDGKYDKAIKLFSQLKTDFKDAREAVEVDKFIAYAETKKQNS